MIDTIFPMGNNVETIVSLNNNFSKPKDMCKLGIDAEDYYRIKDAKND